jgi:Fe-S cluster biogenesis protein NfuA/nitrite reductase/ring-hydroxylating ferredoxin subunit
MDFDKAVAELDTLVATLEGEGDERALLLLQLVDAIHRPALERIAAGELDHPIAQALLQMYDLAPVDDELLVEEALDEVRPYVHSHGGEVELLSVDDGVVRLRMSGACSGCAASAMTLKRGIETALRDHYPGFREAEAEEAEPAPPLLQIENARRPDFALVDPADAPGAGELSATEVAGVDVLMANVDGEVYAFRNACPVDGTPLEGGRLTPNGVLVCPWHNCAYDARSGTRIDDEGEQGLAPVPIAVRDGELQVAVNVA